MGSCFQCYQSMIHFLLWPTGCSLPFAQCERCMLTMYVNITQCANHITDAQVPREPGLTSLLQDWSKTAIYYPRTTKFFNQVFQVILRIEIEREREDLVKKHTCTRFFSKQSQKKSFQMFSVANKNENFWNNKIRLSNIKWFIFCLMLM